MKRLGRKPVAIWRENQPMPKSAVSRFWSKVKKTEECWLWTGMQMRTGHGYFPVCVMSWKGPAWRHEAAHRVAYGLCVKPIPSGMYVLHTCDNGACVRPDHLRLGSQKENMADASTRKRVRHGSAHPEAKLTEQIVATIRQAYANGGQTENALAVKYGVSWSAIGQILRGNTWRHVEGPRIPKGVYPNRKLTEQDVAEMRRLRKQGVSVTALAKRFGICKIHAGRVSCENSKWWRWVS